MSRPAQRTDAFPIVRRVSVPVSALTTTILASMNVRGYDSAVIYLSNDGSDTLNAQVETSPDSTYPGAVLANDAFAAMAPGTVRTLTLSGDVQNFRITGAFAAISGNVTVSVIFQRNSR